MPAGPGVFRHCARVLTSVLRVVLLLLSSIAAASAQVASAPVPRRPLAADLPVYEPVTGAPERRDVKLQNPTGAVALREALGLALLQNPALAGYAWEIRALEARILQAGRPPNPSASLLLEDIGAVRAGSSLEQFVQPQATLQLSQLIELGGKRAARQQLATATRDVAAWDYESARINVLTEVTRAFTDVLTAQRSLALADDTARLVDEVRQGVSTRVQAGVVSPIEETRAGVAAANARVDSARARRILDASRARLALLWGSPASAFTSATGDLETEPAPLPSIASLTARIEQSPELARWTAELAQREAAVSAERAKRVPDVSVAAGYRRFTDIDSNAFLIGASIALPFFDRNKGGIEEARSRLAKTYEDQRASRTRAGALLADAYAALAAAHDEVTALRTEIIPGSQQAFDAVTEGYRLGKFGYLDVLDAQRTLVAARNQYLRALADYHKAVASVERLIGGLLAGASSLPPASRE